MAARLLALVAIAPLLGAAGPQEDHAEPYRILQEAHRTLDPSLAASAYTSDGVLAFEYPGMPAEAFKGTAAIRSSYVRSFGQVAPGKPIELEFRFDPPGLGFDAHKGAYKLMAEAGGRTITVYGRFSVRLAKENGSWRFAEDRGTAATAADFEKLKPRPLE